MGQSRGHEVAPEIQTESFIFDLDSILGWCLEPLDFIQYQIGVQNDGLNRKKGGINIKLESKMMVEHGLTWFNHGLTWFNMA